MKPMGHCKTLCKYFVIIFAWDKAHLCWEDVIESSIKHKVTDMETI